MTPKFELPMPKFVDEGDAEFKELEESHLAWVKAAVEKKLPEDMIIAVVFRAVAAGCIISGVGEAEFLQIARTTYRHMMKMKESGRG